MKGTAFKREGRKEIAKGAKKENYFAMFEIPLRTLRFNDRVLCRSEGLVWIFCGAKIAHGTNAPSGAHFLTV